jgi:alpha-ketoglutarate-dependent taurine dioxygenase
MLLFRGLHLDADALLAFSSRLGEVDVPHGVPDEAFPLPGVMIVSINRDNPLGEILKGAFRWHFDGSLLETPQKATVLSAEAVDETGGETQFASTYSAYEDLSDDEKLRYARLRVVHSPAASQRAVHENPTAEQLAEWDAAPRREHPLVWKHRSGRQSLVIGSTAESIVGMDAGESRDLLDSLLTRATRPERVYQFKWSVGDVVAWDNLGLLHRACPYEETSPRRLLRCTLVGDEPVR